MTRRSTLLPWVLCLLPLGHGRAQTLPTGGAFTAGAGGITAVGQTLTISQSSARGIIAWPNFSIAPGGTVIFDNGAGATLNRVSGVTPSSIAGSLTATGSVYLINPNGIVVTPTGKILTSGSFFAATRDVPDSAFMSGGIMAFTGASPGVVSNEGAITSKTGSVNLIGAAVQNAGAITAPNGTATLAAANRVIFTTTAGLYVAPDTTATGSVTNSGAIRAAAASLAAAGGNVYALAGNRSGLIQATGTGKIGGQIWLTAPNGAVAISAPFRATAPAGGTIIADGRLVTLTSTANLTATGTDRGGGTILAGISAPGGVNEARETSIAAGATLSTGRFGHIETSGRTLALGDAAITAGPGGTWLLDPTELTIDGQAAAAIDAALDEGSNVTEQTTAAGSGDGDITIAAPLTWSSAATLTLSAFADIDIGALITITGNGGVALTAGNNASGRSPQTAALNFLNGGAINYSAGADTNPAPLTINGARYSLIFDARQLQSVGSTGDYALAGDLNLAGVNFAPIAPSGFNGIFNGLGNDLTNLTIDDTVDNDVGLFGEIGVAGSVENLGLVGGATIGGGGFFSAVGALAGINAGTIRDDFSTGPVSASGPHAIGGLVGGNNGLIAQSYATGAVAATGAGTGDVGGLVGATNPNGVLQDDYASGAVTGAPFSMDGGLAGLNFETVIEDAYATGAVTGGNRGGLVANDQAGSYLDAYFNTTTTGVANGAGIGLTTAQWLTEGPLAAGSPYSFIQPAAWRAGAPYPVLAALPYVTLTVSGNQTYGGQPSANLISITNAVGQKVGGVDTANLAFLTDTSPVTGIGTYALGGTGALDPGIQIDVTGSLTITPASLTITANGATSTYGDTPALDGGFTVAGLVNDDTIANLTLATSATAASSIGAYAIIPKASGADLANYRITYIPGTLTILPAPLIITAGAQSKQIAQTLTLGDSDFTVAGLRNGDAVTAVILTSAGAPAGAALTNAAYPIIPSAAFGRGLSNYKITYIAGALTITPLTADPQNAGLLPDGNTQPTTLLLAAGPAGSSQIALPQTITSSDAAGLVSTPAGLTFSTGLPIAGAGDTLPLLTERARHLTLRLPHAMAHQAVGAF
jgi:filamentous hemagglutinin family protein